MRETKFKNSDVGEIPADWECVKISTIAKGVFAGKNVKRTPFGRFPVFGSTGIIAFSNEYAFDFPSILIARVGANAGTINKVDGYYDVTDNTLIIKLKEDALRDYLYYQLLTKNLNALKSGSGQPLITGTQIKNVDILLPTNNEKYCETERIVDALSDIDALISISKKLIEKKINIKQGAMQELLSGKRRLPGFTQPWVEKSIGSICKPYKGSQINKNDLEEANIGYPVMNGGISPSGYHYECNEPADTIIMSEGGNSCGYVSFMKTPFWAGGHCYVLRPQKQISLDYFYQVLKFYEPKIMGLRTGSGLPNIKKTSLSDFVLVLSDNQDEQTAIAKILSDMDSEISSLESRLAKFQLLKQGMMQQLLTGKIRLVCAE